MKTRNKKNSRGEKLKSITDRYVEGRRANFRGEEFLMGSRFIVRVNPDDGRIANRGDCSGCMANYKYAKRHNKRILYNIYTDDIVGVSMESNIKKGE